jgi:CubicO group peptidase (beta-lactamase class C family)
MFDTTSTWNSDLTELSTAISNSLNEPSPLDDPLLKQSSSALHGTEGDDSLLGTDQANWITGKKGNDYLNGYAGNDFVLGGEGNDRVFGGSGDDWLVSGTGNNELYGGSGRDRLLGDSGNDRLDGGTGNDVLNGGEGENILIDRDGNDRLTGGSGKDEFWIGNGGLGATVVTNFEVGRDRLKLLDLNITYDKLQLHDNQNGAVITYQGKDLAQLDGVNASQLTASQFDFGNAQLGQDLQTTIQQVVQNTGTPGATASVSLADGTTWTGAAGVSDLETGTAMKADDRMSVGSITKAMTATVTLQLAQEEKLSLDDTLTKWLPDIAKSIPNGEQITLRQLLNNTSGIQDYDDGLEQDIRADLSLGSKSWTTEELLSRYVYGKDALFAPGQRFSYSNTNYRLLGDIIESATQSSMKEQLQTRIFEPLGMNNSFYANPDQIPGGVARGYIDLNQDGKLDPKVDLETSGLNLQGIVGAEGGVISTASDLSRFNQSLVDGELLSPATFQQMKTDSYPGSNYGLGLEVATLPDGTEVLGHTGNGLGWSSRTFDFPQQGITLSVMTNSDASLATKDLPPEAEAWRQLSSQIYQTILKDTLSTSKAV